MNRKIQTSSGKRKFYHQNDSKNNITQNHIIRPPTSHPYSGLNHYRSSAKLRNQYDSNYFTGKIFADRKNHNQNQTEINIQKTSQRFKVQQYQNVPKIFKLLFTQLKVLLKNYIIQEDQFKQVLKNLTKKVRQIHENNQQMKQKLKIKTKQYQISMNTVQNLNIKIKQLTQHHHNINQTKNNNFLSTISTQNQEKKINFHYFYKIFIYHRQMNHICTQSNNQNHKSVHHHFKQKNKTETHNQQQNSQDFITEQTISK